MKYLPKAIEYSDIIGVLKTVAVKTEFKGMGIGTALIEDTLTKMKKSDIQSVIGLAWKNKNGVNVGGIMKSFKFNFFQEITEFWKKDSLEKDFSCPECGSPPCKCSAQIYFKTL